MRPALPRIASVDDISNLWTPCARAEHLIRDSVNINANDRSGRMPTKQEIEAELHAGEKDKAMAKLCELIADIGEYEAALRDAEKKVWQPHWSHGDPLRDRLLRAGKSPQEVAEFERWFAAIEALRLGKAVPADIQKEIDDVEAAENSALQQLAEVVRRARK